MPVKAVPAVGNYIDWRVAWLWIALPLIATGCGGQTEVSKTEVNATSLSASDILAQVKTKYQNTTRYADAGEQFFQGLANGKLQRIHTLPCAVAFERPNRVRISSNGAVLVSDGQLVHGAVLGIDARTAIPNQVLELPALRTGNYDLLSSDALLRDALAGPFDAPFLPQFALLVGQDPLGKLQSEPTVQRGHINEAECYLLNFENDGAVHTYWIDCNSFIVHRVDIVQEKLQRLIDPQLQMGDFRFRVEMHDAILDEELPSAAFQFEVPPEARLVRRLVMPNPPLPDRLGNIVSEFHFVDLGGNTIDRKTLGDKVLVLDFWFTNCEPCRQSFPLSEKLYRTFRDDDRIAFLAVSIDGTDIDERTIESTLRDWGATMPIARDLEHFWSTSFQLRGTPSLVVLDARNRIQAFHDGPLNDIASLQRLLDRIAGGEDVAQTELARHASLEREFELELQRTSIDSTNDLVEVLQTTIAPKQEPQYLRVEKIADYADLKQPGNLLVLSREHEPHIFVLDEANVAAEVDLEGHLIAKHPLDPAISVSHLRASQVNDSQSLFLAHATGRPHVCLFNEQWKLQWRHPQEDRLKVGDTVLTDIIDDATPEIIVGFYDVAGLHCLNAAGEVLWTNRAVENVRCVAVAGDKEDGGRSVLAVGTRGTIVHFDAHGKQLDEWRIANRAVLEMETGDIEGEGQPEIAVLLLEPGKDTQVEAAGLSPSGEELWRYRLPDGFPNPLVERIIPVEISGAAGGWLFPAADGSIHLVDAEGRLVDSFTYGAELTGLALVSHGNQSTLLVATVEGLSSWRIAPRDP
ncbi:MAG: redoxin domain-containing protein [Planctomycetales bacterium]|nr:redoxin domain-containing protein [Planctomycetales bacterium]